MERRCIVEGEKKRNIVREGSSARLAHFAHRDCRWHTPEIQFLWLWSVPDDLRTIIEPIPQIEALVLFEPITNNTGPGFGVGELGSHVEAQQDESGAQSGYSRGAGFRCLVLSYLWFIQYGRL